MGEMMLATPCFIVHRLDSRSPLVPPDEAAFPPEPYTQEARTHGLA
jgi:hypothetical protein